MKAGAGQRSIRGEALTGGIDFTRGDLKYGTPSRRVATEIGGTEKIARGIKNQCAGGAGALCWVTGEAVEQGEGPRKSV